MKKFLISLLVLIILAGAGFFGWKYFLQGYLKKQQTKKEPFIWGVTMRPHALGNYTSASWLEQVKLAKDLGVNYIRIGWQYDAWRKGKPDQFGFHDEIFQTIQDNGLSVYVVFEGNPDVLEVNDPYYDGYNNAFQIASHYKGKVKYYQMLNEVGSVPLKEGKSGENESDYDEAKYQKVKEWLKGASAGIKKADPNAYRVISCQWLQTGFISRLEKDKIDYDIIGWDWFSDMGLMSEKKLTDGTLLIDKLISFNKPVILAEINQRPEGEGGQKGMPEQKQADFIEKTAEWAYSGGQIKGFIVLELMDVVNTGKDFTDYYGLVETQKTGKNTGIPGQPRKAYNVYKEIIAKYSSS